MPAAPLLAQVAVGYPFDAHDVMWTQRNTIVYPLTCALAGLCAGMFGIGGGIIKGPLYAVATL